MGFHRVLKNDFFLRCTFFRRPTPGTLWTLTEEPGSVASVPFMADWVNVASRPCLSVCLTANFKFLDVQVH